MKKRVRLFAIVIVAVFVLIILFASAFYASAYIKANNCIAYVNRNSIGDSVKADWISASDFKALQIVDENILKKDIYVNMKTRPKFSWLAWNKISITFDITVWVGDCDSSEKIAEYQQKREMILVFSDFKWKVDGVHNK